MESGLYIVATPIGNLGDISARAVEVLKSVDLIAAEDTRHSRRLFQQFAIDTQCFAYHDFSDRGAQERVLARLAAGESVALVSDAGTPLISDPGFRLVRDVQEAGFRVFPIPGACAAIAALSVAGLPTDRFLFEGFLPAKAGARAARLSELAQEEATMIFYEAPHRIADSLQAMTQAFGADREATLAREITKAFETLHRAPLAELTGFVAADSNQQRGEIVLLVAGHPLEKPELDERTAKLLRQLAEEMPGKRAAAIVAEFSGLKKNQLYDYLLAQRSD
ncbi:MAG: 16S rRNA (cytidine(1402)-2'-O)-methyltransferase [Halieaceae bacterium]